MTNECVNSIVMFKASRMLFHRMPTIFIINIGFYHTILLFILVFVHPDLIWCDCLTNPSFLVSGNLYLHIHGTLPFAFKLAFAWRLCLQKHPGTIPCHCNTKLAELEPLSRWHCESSTGSVKSVLFKFLLSDIVSIKATDVPLYYNV